jgi:predicted MFS family arabinose efflux permease
VDLRLLVPALGTFAIGTGSFVFAGLLGDVAEDLSVSVGNAGQLIMVYAVGSPVLVTLTGAVARRRLLIVSLVVFAGATSYAAVRVTTQLTAEKTTTRLPVKKAATSELVAKEHCYRRRPG